MVCEYWPAGNVLGQSRSNVQSRVGAQIDSSGGEGFIGKNGGRRAGMGGAGWWVIVGGVALGLVVW